MKLLKFTKFSFIICLVSIGFWAKAQRFAVASGNWNDAIWATTYNGSAGSAATPTSSDDVFTNGFSVTVNTDVSCKNLNVRRDLANSLIIEDFSFATVNVNGYLSGANATTPTPGTQPISISNALTMGEFETIRLQGVGEKIRAWGYINPLGSVTIAPGVSSTATITQGFRISNSATLTIESGIISISSNSLSRQLRGCSSCAMVINSGATLNTASAINGGGVTSSDDPSTSFGNINVNGTLIVSNYVNAANFSLSSTGSFQTGYSTVDQTEGWWYQSIRPTSGTIDSGSTISFNASANQNIYTRDYSNLTLTGSGTKTVVGTGSVNIQGNLLFGNSGVTLTSSQVVVFDGTNGQQISGGGTANFNGGITLNKASGTLTIAEDINWQGVMNLTQGTLAFTNNSTVTATGVASITGAANPSFYSLAVSGAGSLTSSSGNINIAGNFTNNGIFNSNNGTLTFNGTSAQVIQGSTNTSFNNLTSSNSSTVTFSSPQSLTGALSLSAGTLNANGNLTLVSTISGDARIAQITGGTISGNINAQRYLPNAGGVRDYRFLASPVTNATVSQWKNTFPITGTFDDPSTAAEWSGFTNPPVSEAAPSLFLYNEAHTPTSTQQDRYESFPTNGSSSTSTTLVNGDGYAAFVRQTAPVTITVTGTPKQGNANVSVTAQSGGGNDGWNLIGNPYAAPIDWDNVTIPSGVGTQIALLDNTGTIGTQGNYVYFTQGVGGTHSGIIPSGQAFWVRASANATITFQENDKVAVSNPVFAREGSLADLLRIKISGNDKADELIIYFKESARDVAEGRSDAFKLKNPTINFSSLSSDGVELAINGMGALSCGKEISLSIKGVTPGKHILNFSELSNFDSNVGLKLVDNYTSKSQIITTDPFTYEFDVTADAASFGSGRFKVVIGYPDILTNLNVQGENICTGTDSKITVSNSQSGVNYYAAIGGTAVSDVTPGNGSALSIIIPQNKLINGYNQVVIMASSGECTTLALAQLASIKKEDIYSATQIISKGACKQGEVTLTATGAPTNGSYHWYESSEATAPIAGQVSAVFKTPTLLKSKTYYVTVVNALGCEGEKTEAVAKITNFDDAAITQTGYATIQSNFEIGNQWYLNNVPIAGATSKTLEVNESGVYKVKVSVEGSCETTAEISMIVTDLKTQLENNQFYPNPVKNILTIKLPAEKGAALGAIQNEIGQNIGQIYFKPNEDFLIGEFNFEEKMPGIYIIRITQGNSITNHKIVKK